MVHLITGYAGQEHIQSADQGSFNASFFGTGEYVMEMGEQFDASIIDNNTVRVLDGDILMQGRHIRVEPTSYNDMTISTGTAGMLRYDLIVMTYTKNADTGVETAAMEVIKGTPVASNPSDPDYVTGDILGGDSKNQMLLYRVKVNGVVLDSIEQLFQTIPTYATLAEQYEQEFQTACQTYLDSLDILDTAEEIEANTEDNMLAGALGVKEEITSIKSSLTNYATNTSLANALAWKVLKTNATSVSLASIWDSFNEIQVLARYKYDSSQTYCTSTIIPKQEIPDGSNSHTYMFFSGSRFASTTGIGARIDVYQSTVKLNGFYVDGTSKTSNIYIDVLYR